MHIIIRLDRVVYLWPQDTVLAIAIYMLAIYFGDSVSVLPIDRVRTLGVEGSDHLAIGGWNRVKLSYTVKLTV